MEKEKGAMAEEKQCEILDQCGIEITVHDYEELRERQRERLLAYAEAIQKLVQQKSKEVIEELVEVRHEQKKTQQEIADYTGIKPSNLARFENCSSIPTLLVLEKYASALGKHIEIKICDNEEDKYEVVLDERKMQ